jgi:signal transduction histidine kinase/ActR/RegA family two-component response regulator
LETFDEILGGVTDAWIAIDGEWRVTYVNRAAERLLQRERTTLVRGLFWESFPVLFVDAFGGALEEAARTSTIVEVEQHLPALYRWFEVRVYPSGEGLALCARDITERRRQQEGLRRTETALRQNQKLEAIGRLAGGIAHDFNNLLTAIKGYSDLILADLGESGAAIDVGHLRDDIGEIRKAADRAAGLTGQLLAFGRKQVMQPRLIDLNASVAEMEKMLRRVISEDIEMRLALSPDAECVTADPTQIEQVLMNIVLNARDAMPEGGRLTIETGRAQLDEAYAARHVGVTPGDYVLLSVSDNGQGMDAETQARLFEPFFTTKEQGKGTGLGLATAYGIVKQSGGNIWAYSEIGIGTTIKVYLPRSDSEAPRRVSGPVEAPVSVRGTETVLVVEDEISVRQLVSGVLKRCGYTVIVADDGFDALRAIEGQSAKIDLLLTDVVMPGMSGRRLADRLAAERPGLRILYMSGYTEHAIVHHGVLDAGTDFIEKPFTPEQLTRKVRHALDRVAARPAARDR